MIVQGPDGQQFDFPDNTPQDVMKGALRKRYGGPEGMASDIAKSGATGVVEGGIGLAGALGDIQGLVDKGVGWGAEKLGYDPAVVQGTIKAAQQVGGRAPTSQQITTTAKDAGVPFHAPQTTAGEYARTAGQFLPASLLGPGSAGAKLASGVAGAVGSETAGQVTKGTDVEPYARFAAGAALGGGAAAMATRPSRVVSQVAKSAPSQAMVKGQAGQMYDTLRNAGIRYNSQAYQQLADNVSVGAVQSGFRKVQAPLSFDIIEHLNKTRGLSPDFSDIDSLRKSVGTILREPNASQTDKALASRILDRLDNFAESAPIAPGSQMSAQQASQMAGQAREMARRNIIGRDVDEMMRKAETYQSGYTSGLRNQFSNYLRSPRGKRLTPEEQAAFAEVAKGNFATNVLNTLGRFGFDFSKLGNISSLLPSAAAATAYGMGLGPVGAAGIAIGGTAAKYAGRKMTEGFADRAKQVVMAGKPGQQTIRIANQNKAQRLRDIMVRSLLSGEASRKQPPQP